MRRYVTTTACNFWRQITCSFQAKFGNVLLIAKKYLKSRHFFKPGRGIWAKKVHACSLRFSALKPCSGAHYRQGQIREYAPLPGNTYRTKNSPCNTYIIWSLERKNKHRLAGKWKLQNINIKEKENKTRIRIKISEFYKWYSSNTVYLKDTLVYLYLLVHWRFLECFMVWIFFCLIFVIKGVPGDPSRQGGCPGPFRVLQTPWNVTLESAWTTEVFLACAQTL